MTLLEEAIEWTKRTHSYLTDVCTEQEMQAELSELPHMNAVGLSAHIKVCKDWLKEIGMRHVDMY